MGKCPDAIMLQQTKVRGSGVGNFVSGTEITTIAQLHVGDLAASFSPQFNALNLMRVTRITEDGSRAYGVFVNPHQPHELRLASDEEFCIWDHEINCSVILHKVVTEAAPEALGPATD